MDVEVWKDVVFYEGIYEVSSFGNVRKFKCKKELRKFFDIGGYWKVSLGKNKKWKQMFVHKLVAEAFIGPKPDGLVIDHIDHRRPNNNVHNLQYITQKENVRRGRVCNKITAWH